MVIVVIVLCIIYSNVSIVYIFHSTFSNVLNVCLGFLITFLHALCIHVAFQLYTICTFAPLIYVESASDYTIIIRYFHKSFLLHM